MLNFLKIANSLIAICAVLDRVKYHMNKDLCISLFKKGRYFLQPMCYFNMLRAHFFTLPAIDAVGSFAKGFSIVVVIYVFNASGQCSVLFFGVV